VPYKEPVPVGLGHHGQRQPEHAIVNFRPAIGLANLAVDQIGRSVAVKWARRLVACGCKRQRTDGSLICLVPMNRRETHRQKDEERTEQRTQGDATATISVAYWIVPQARTCGESDHWESPSCRHSLTKRAQDCKLISLRVHFRMRRGWGTQPRRPARC
jgi:hypothetical protein